MNGKYYLHSLLVIVYMIHLNDKYLNYFISNRKVDFNTDTAVTDR